MHRLATRCWKIGSSSGPANYIRKAVDCSRLHALCRGSLRLSNLSMRCDCAGCATKTSMSSSFGQPLYKAIQGIKTVWCTTVPKLSVQSALQALHWSAPSYIQKIAGACSHNPVLHRHRSKPAQGRISVHPCPARCTNISVTPCPTTDRVSENLHSPLQPK